MPDQTEEFRSQVAALRAEAAILRAEAGAILNEAADAILNEAAAKEREADRLELSVAEADNYARNHKPIKTKTAETGE